MAKGARPFGIIVCMPVTDKLLELDRQLFPRGDDPRYNPPMRARSSLIAKTAIVSGLPARPKAALAHIQG